MYETKRINLSSRPKSLQTRNEREVREKRERELRAESEKETILRK